LLNATLYSLSAYSSWPASEDFSNSGICLYVLLRYLYVDLSLWTKQFIKTDEEFCKEITDACSVLRLYIEPEEVHEDIWTPLTMKERLLGERVNWRCLIQGRSLCVTEQKRICNVTGKLRSGDVIALLAGGTAAYVLRPVGNSYQCIGSAYVHGIMDGEAYKDVSPSDVDEEIRLI